MASAAGGALVIPHSSVITAAIVLGLVALALAWPVPVALSRAAWPMRAPVMALLLWQAIGLAGGFSMIGALALAGIALMPDQLLLASVPAAVFAVYLLCHLAVTVMQVTRLRHRHLALLEMLTSPHPTRARTRVIDDSVPVAYCLPNGAKSVTVLSKGLLDRLDSDELVAVIAHERAHVEQRHDLLLLAFRAWRAALPWFPIAARAEAEVAALVEMLADDQARREVHDEVLARAILAVGAGGAPGAEIVVSGSTRVSDRFRRLAG
ncbi:Peptidase M48, Ste24p precursor [Microbacterium esteraromaticum]|uniref:Peptidase M48, Ste24p n=1 Tax=Microbacterium esteraromaticum TaxID=57043 RepID=A0A1R4KF35_9MICO|nr:M56 family metallopeptidase [Microbacterium esteraromaticum]SJN42916.1 Peptidase M48, Ste24p precursor [Microbacterium esteraromaticum]